MGLRTATRARSLFAKEVWPRVAAVLSNRNASVLVAFDLDGTLAPITPNPKRVRVPAEVKRMIRRTARAPKVTVAIVTARSRKDLLRLLPGPRILRAPQYGLEGPLPPSPAQRRRWHRAAAQIALLLRPVAARAPGSWVEPKGLTVAIHDRGVPPSRLGALRRATARIVRVAGRLGFGAIPGSRVTEFVPRGAGKGRALRAIRGRVRPGSVFYFGDSSADESAFAILRAPDFPVRVGPGPTHARFRVQDHLEILRYLRALVALRSRSDP